VYLKIIERFIAVLDKQPASAGKREHKGTVSVKTKTEKSTGKSASALDREGNER
jgi:hypothetical protein